MYIYLYKYNYLCIYLYILFILVQYIRKRSKHMDSPVVWMSIPHIQNMIFLNWKKTIYFLGCFDCSITTFAAQIAKAPLHYAAWQGHVEVAKAHSVLGSRDCFQVTPMLQVAFCHHPWSLNNPLIQFGTQVCFSFWRGLLGRDNFMVIDVWRFQKAPEMNPSRVSQNAELNTAGADRWPGGFYQMGHDGPVWNDWTTTKFCVWSTIFFLKTAIFKSMPYTAYHIVL